MFSVRSTYFGSMRLAAVFIIVSRIILTASETMESMSGMKNEVFFLNVEDSYFGCQVNESLDILQLFKISKICDGVPDCFTGLDENHSELKCTDDCKESTGGKNCKNGVCLESQCYCDDGYAGKACELPDDNECKLRPCDVFAHCTNTIGSFLCTCFPGYEGDGFNCKDIDECKIPKLRDKCKANAECYNLPAHYICKCNPGYEGDGEIGCEDINECLKGDACGENSICKNYPGNYTCECPKGFAGDPFQKCADIDECFNPGACPIGAQCTNFPGSYSCSCGPGFSGDPNGTGCSDIDECLLPDACPSNSVCKNVEGSYSCKCQAGFEMSENKTCTDINECNVDGVCGENSRCVNQVGTFTCLCGVGQVSPLGVLECTGQPCDVDHRSLLLEKNCSCPKTSFYDKSGLCTLCDEVNGFSASNGGQCLCSTSNITESGRPPKSCFCRKENTYVGNGEQCSEVKSCRSDLDCTSNTSCSNATNTCRNPCATKSCGANAYCQTVEHVASCLCPQWLTGNGDIGCSVRPGRTDFPRPELTVNCLADSIQVDIALTNFLDLLPNSNTPGELFYVKGYSKDPDCRKLIGTFGEPVDFRVKFGTCGLSHSDGEAGFVLVVQKHPRLVTYSAQAYNIKCLYNVGEKTVKMGLNISGLTTAGTISNTGPPPICLMRVVTISGKEVTSAEIGASLLLRISVQPSNIYTGFVRNCVAKTTEGDDEIEYIVTDDDGCATDPSIFGDWKIIQDTQALNAHFNAFKFPTSGGIRFQCDVRVCFGTCVAVDCHNRPAFGRRKRDVLKSQIGSFATNHLGQLVKEEITLQSNIILTIDNREDRIYNPSKAQKILKKEVCMSTTGFLVTIFTTALLTLVTATITASCWITVLRRRVNFPSPIMTSNVYSNSYYTTRKLLLQSPPD